MSLRRLATSLVALLVLLGTAACSDDPEPKFADPSDEPSTSTSVPTSDPPTSGPPERESPEEFVRRFQQASFEMQRTGNLDPYLSLTLDCRSCDDLAARVADIYESGGNIELRDGSVRDVSRITKTRGVLILEYALHALSTTIRNGSGDVVERFPGGVDRFQLNIDRLDGQWKVTRINSLGRQ